MLSDVLADAAINVTKGADWYGDMYPDRYPQEEVIEWVRHLVRLMVVAAGAIQDGAELPALPKVPDTTSFVGLQLHHEKWPCGVPS